MKSAILEHVNISVSDPHRTATILQDFCAWTIRWEGAAMNNGYTVHVGSERGYVALYSNADTRAPDFPRDGLNHVGLQVDDLDKALQTVRARGLEPYHLSEYEPGRRFYFRDHDGIEFEVVSYE